MLQEGGPPAGGTAAAAEEADMGQGEGAERDDMGRLMVLHTEDVDALAWAPMPGQTGVWSKILWRSGDVAIGLIRVDAGAEKAAHVHHGAHHHIWIVSGSATMLGRALTAGSYVYIPPGVEHEVTGVGRDGITFFYTYRPVETRHRQPRLAGHTILAQ
jgi:mannose-6-phosphate isomerase-like protein (cupin superfamily)